MAHTLNLDPEHPRRKNVFIGRGISMVCMKALHKEPARRFRTATALADDIRAYNEGRPLSVAKPTPLEHTTFWIRREPVRASLILTLSMMALTAIWIVGVQIGADYRLADKALENVARIDHDVAELNTEIAALENRLETGDSNDSATLKQDLDILEARLMLRKVQALNELRSVHRLRFIRADPDLEIEGHKRLLDIFERGADGQHALILLAVMEGTLEDIEEGMTTFDYTDSEVARVLELRDRARKSAGLQP